MAQRKLGRVGVIGLGMIGSHYAGHLLKAIGKVTVFDMDKGRLARATRGGAEAASSPSAVARKCDIMVLSLPSPDAVSSVMLGQDGILKGAQKGALVIDASTVDPETCITMYEAAKEQGVSYIETPISGGEPGEAGTEGAQAGTVTFMVGGDKAAFMRAKPVLNILGSYSLYLGPAGSGSIAKLISNHISGLTNLIVAEAFVLGAAAGFTHKTLLEVFKLTDAKSFMMTEYIAPRINRKDYKPGFSVDLMHKDHRLMGDLGRRLNVPLLFNQLALEVYQMLRSRGDGGKDLTEAINLLGRLANVDIYRPRKRAVG